MKIGSLVVCINDSISKQAKAPYTSPVKGKIYTVREIETFRGTTGIRLEELKSRNLIGHNKEIAFGVNRFHELITPTSISIDEILEQEVII